MTPSPDSGSAGDSTSAGLTPEMPAPRQSTTQTASLPDLIKHHWLSVLVVFGCAVAGTTWTVSQSVMVAPRDFEISRLRESQRAGPDAQVQATLSSSQRALEDVKTSGGSDSQREAKVQALTDRIAILESLLRTSPQGKASLHSDQTGIALVATVERKMGQKYVLGAFVPKDDATWNGPWDNSELISWAVYQVTGKLVGTRPSNDPKKADAYSGFWAEDASTAGRTISLESAKTTAGAILFRAPSSARIGRLAISDGKGSVIEAKSSSAGVVRSSFETEGWDAAILLNGVSY